MDGDWTWIIYWDIGLAAVSLAAIGIVVAWAIMFLWSPPPAWLSYSAIVSGAWLAIIVGLVVWRWLTQP